MNLPGWYFHITKSNQDQWAAKFNKSVEAMHSVAPNLRIAYNPNWGPDQTSGDSRQVFQKVKHNVDYYGIDMYDEWPPDTSDSAWQQRLNGAGGLQDSLNYAKREVRGLDFTTRYHWDLSNFAGRDLGRLDHSLNGSWLIEQKNLSAAVSASHLSGRSSIIFAKIAF